MNIDNGYFGEKLWCRKLFSSAGKRSLLAKFSSCYWRAIRNNNPRLGAGLLNPGVEERMLLFRFDWGFTVVRRTMVKMGADKAGSFSKFQLAIFANS